MIVVFVYLGDEVILLELVYDFYRLFIEVVGGVLVIYELKVFLYSVDWEEFEWLIIFKIRMIIINILYNLMGSIFRKVDLERLE